MVLVICMQRVAASCVWLASKLEESPRKIYVVLQVFNRMERRRENLPLELLESPSQVYTPTSFESTSRLFRETSHYYTQFWLYLFATCIRSASGNMFLDYLCYFDIDSAHLC